MSYTYSVEERFLRYVQIDTTADPNSTSFPSSEKQKDLNGELVVRGQDLVYVFGQANNRINKG